jgi:hypothetical protein
MHQSALGDCSLLIHLPLDPVSTTTMPVLVEALLPECGLREPWSGTGNPPPSRAGINDTSTPSTRAPQKIPLDPLVASGRTLFS